MPKQRRLTPVPDDFIIRPERVADISAIRKLNVEAFEQENEARLVDRLRVEGRFNAATSLVVEDKNGEIIGHALLSVIGCVTDRGPVKTGAIAPGAISKRHRSFKIAGRLMRTLIENARQEGFELLLLLARPHVYGRLGFSAKLAEKVDSVYSSAGEAFMALELKSGVLSQSAWAKAIYPEAFAECDRIS